MGKDMTATVERGILGRTHLPEVERRIWHTREIVNFETPAALLTDSWLTHTGLFFVRNHLPEPRVNLARWHVFITGEIQRPLALTMAELEKLEPAAVTNTLECAGNGRSFYEPGVPGTPWRRGAVGNAVFSGPRLAAVLRLAGLRPTSKHVAFKGLDRAANGVPDFIRSIPIEKAMHPDTVLATEMNGAPLTPAHGFPLRSLVPGWVGAASVKWLTEIRVLPHEFDGEFMKANYRIPQRAIQPGSELKLEETSAITSLPVKCIIAQPHEDAETGLGPVRINGAAWAGEQDIARVDVSIDEGRTWKQASLGRDRARYAWRLWEYIWNPPAPGSYMVMARATDTQGRTQPAQSAWNPHGYLWNAIERARIHVKA